MRYWRVPLDAHEVEIPRGTIHLIVDRCKGCEFCVEFCPRDVLAMSDDFNAKGYHYPVVARPADCVNCDLCEVICPDFAIFCDPAESAAAAPKPAGDEATEAPGSATEGSAVDADDTAAAHSQERSRTAEPEAAASRSGEVGHGSR